MKPQEIVDGVDWQTNPVMSISLTRRDLGNIVNTAYGYFACFIEFPEAP